MQNPQIKFRRFVFNLEKQYGPQGWWPRLVINLVPNTKHQVPVSIFHHPGPKTRWLSKTPADQAFEVAVGAILTQNTAWTNVEKALVCLAEKGMMTSKALADARLPTVEACVRSSGYYRQKAKKLKLYASFVEEELGGDLRKIINCRLERSGAKSKDLYRKNSSLMVHHFGRLTAFIQDDDILIAREKLLAQWGIGPETADTILLYGLNQPVFVVDAYTRRLLVHLTGDASWSKKSYDEVRGFCEAALAPIPSTRYTVRGTSLIFQESHALIVRWGKDNPRLRIS